MKKEIEEESNKWKRKAVKEELKKINSDIKIVKERIETLNKSSESDSATRQAGHWKEQVCEGPF